MSGKLINDKF